MKEIRLKPFDREKSLEFLKAGFEQVVVSVSDRVLEKAVEVFDGTAG
jgi:AAA+ ATPase superfamily predicted ATPase